MIDIDKSELPPPYTPTICRRCGARLPASAAFCHRCGNLLNPAEINQSRLRIKRYPWMKTLQVILAIAYLACLVVFVISVLVILIRLMNGKDIDAQTIRAFFISGIITAIARYFMYKIRNKRRRLIDQQRHNMR